jgi:carbamate kinase
MLTDVDAVYVDWNTPDQRAIASASPADLRGLDLPAGSMGPKVAAACEFVEGGGSFAAIGRLDDASGLVDGTAGTRIAQTGESLSFRA